MATFLQGKGAYQIVTGITPRPQDPAAAADWDLKDQIRKEMITTGIKDEQVIHISECVTAAQMWDALRIIHEPRSQQTIISTMKVLYSTKAAENADIPTHLHQMRAMCERLTILGHIINNTDFKAILVASLPCTWEGWTSSYFSYQGGLQGNNKADSATVQEVISIVCDEFQRRKEKQNGGDFTYTSASGTSQKQKPRKCATCGRTNHVTANCRFKGKPKCGICDCLGHNNKECWKNPLNKGKGKATFGQDNKRPDFKDKPCTNVNKDDSDSDTEQLQ
jgi:hypothetical protein